MSLSFITLPDHILKNSILIQKQDVSSQQGKRSHMEDRYIIASQGTWQLYGVFDGHGGKWVAETLRDHFPDIIFKHLPDLKLAFEEMDSLLFKLYLSTADKEDAGSTATIFLYDIKTKQYWLAWIGDTKAMIFNNKKVINRTIDHQPHLEKEEARIKKFGHVVNMEKYDDEKIISRIDNDLAVSRAFGNQEFKPGAVIVEPDVLHGKLTDKATIIIATDGLWDVIHNDDEIIQHVVIDREDADTLVSFALEQGSTDNVTAMIIRT